MAKNAGHKIDSLCSCGAIATCESKDIQQKSTYYCTECFTEYCASLGVVISHKTNCYPMPDEYWDEVCLNCIHQSMQTGYCARDPDHEQIVDFKKVYNCIVHNQSV